MEKAQILLFTSPTCPYCPGAKKLLNEYTKERTDFEITEFSIATEEGRSEAQKYDVTSVPTYIIKGPGYPENIGLTGAQSKADLAKYIDMSLGLNQKKDIEEKEKKRDGFRIGKFRIKF